MERSNVTRRTSISTSIAPFGDHKIISDRAKNVSCKWWSKDRRTHANVTSLCFLEDSFDKGEPMRYHMGKDIGVQEDNHSHNGAQSNGMPNHKAEDLAFISYLIGSRGGDNDRLRVHHLAHHSAGAIRCTHQDGIEIQLLCRDALQAPEQRIRRGITAGECNAQPAEKCAKEREEPSGSREGQAQYRIHAGVASDVAEPEHGGDREYRKSHAVERAPEDAQQPPRPYAQQNSGKERRYEASAACSREPVEVILGAFRCRF